MLALSRLLLALGSALRAFRLSATTGLVSGRPSCGITRERLQRRDALDRRPVWISSCVRAAPSSTPPGCARKNGACPCFFRMSATRFAVSGTAQPSRRSRSSTLALGIGANAAVFSVVSQPCCSRRCPIASPIASSRSGRPTPPRNWTHATVAPANLLDWRARQPIVRGDRLLHRLRRQGTRHQRRDADRSGGAGPRPRHGRLGQLLCCPRRRRCARPHVYSAEERRGHSAVIVLSHGFWLRRFAGDAASVGRTIDLDGASVQVIGVMPRRFTFPGAEADFWAPRVYNEPLVPQHAPAALVSRDRAASARRHARPGPRRHDAHRHRARARVSRHEHPDGRRARPPARVVRRRQPPRARHAHGRRQLSSSSSRARTSPVSCSPAPRRGAGSSRFASPSAPAGCGCCGSCSPRAWSWPAGGAASGHPRSPTWRVDWLRRSSTPAGVPRLDQTAIDGWVLGFIVLTAFATALVVRPRARVAERSLHSRGHAARGRPRLDRRRGSHAAHADRGRGRALGGAARRRRAPGQELHSAPRRRSRHRFYRRSLVQYLAPVLCGTTMTRRRRHFSPRP